MTSLHTLASGPASWTPGGTGRCNRPVCQDSHLHRRSAVGVHTRRWRAGGLLPLPLLHHTASCTRLQQQTIYINKQHTSQYVRRSFTQALQSQVLVVHFTLLKTLLTDSSTLTCLTLFLWDSLPFQKLKLLYFHQDGATPYYILILLVKKTSSQSWIGRRGLLRLGHNVHLSFKDFYLLRFCQNTHLQ